MQPDTSTTYLKQGQHFQREGLLSEAEVAYRQAIELNPIFYGSFRYLGEVLALEGKLDQAVEAYQRAKELNPKALWVHQRLGEVFLQLNKLEDAIACFQTAIEINSDFSWAYNGLGDCWSWKGNRENAISNYQKAVELNPISDTFRDNLEKVLAERNHPSEEEISDKVENSLKLGQDLIAQGNVGGAISAFRLAIEINPLEINPSSAPLYYQLGQALEELIEHQPDTLLEQIQSNNIAIKSGVDSEQVLFINDEIFLEKTNHLDDEDFNKVFYRTYLKRDPSENEQKAGVNWVRSPGNSRTIGIRNGRQLPEFKTLLHKSLWLAFDIITYYRRVIEIDPSYFEAYLKLGKHLQAIGDLEGAISFLSQAIQLKQCSSDLHFQLGNLLEKNGQIKEAVKRYQEVIDLDLNYPEAYARLGKLNRQLGIFKRKISEETLSNKDLSLSVVIPTYNRANSLRLTLPNYLKTDRSDIEFVIIDNDSPDDTPDVVRSFMEQDKRIRYFRNSFNVGGARNYYLGILYAKAPLIMLASDDDHITEGFVDLVIWIFENHPTVGAVHNLAWPHERQNAFAANQRGGHLYQKCDEAILSGPVTWTNLIGGITFRRTVINQQMWKLDASLFPQAWLMANIAMNYDMYGLFCETEYIQQNVIPSSNPFEGMIMLDYMAKGETRWDNGYPEQIDFLLYRLWLLDLSPYEKPGLFHPNASGCYRWLAYVIFPTWYSKSRDRAFTYLGVTLRYPYMRFSILFWQHFVNSILTTHCFNNIGDRVFIILLGCHMLMWRLIIHLTEYLEPGLADFFYVGQWPRKDAYDITASQGNRFGIDSLQIGYSAATVIKDLQGEIEV
jgi:tetratricopeptide (TPR) repeat protein/glycosyltransferase involved in cell wall biosynthesis